MFVYCRKENTLTGELKAIHANPFHHHVEVTLSLVQGLKAMPLSVVSALSRVRGYCALFVNNKSLAFFVLLEMFDGFAFVASLLCVFAQNLRLIPLLWGLFSPHLTVVTTAVVVVAVVLK
jgi:hypothetical protein